MKLVGSDLEITNCTFVGNPPGGDNWNAYIDACIENKSVQGLAVMSVERFALFSQLLTEAKKMEGLTCCEIEFDAMIEIVGKLKKAW